MGRVADPWMAECDHCGERFDVVLSESDASDRPVERPCPSCGESAVAEPPLSAQDDDRKLTRPMPPRFRPL